MGGKSEEEKRFDFALSSAVSKVSFWFVNGNIDKEDLNNGVAKLGSSRYRGKKGSYEKMHTLESDEEDKFGKTVPDLSKAIGDRLNAKANAQMQMKERIEREREAQQQREMLRNDNPENHSRARAEFLQGRTEEVQENSRSILNSIIGASAPLAPPRQTFSMDPFGQKIDPTQIDLLLQRLLGCRSLGPFFQECTLQIVLILKPTIQSQTNKEELMLTLLKIDLLVDRLLTNK